MKRVLFWVLAVGLVAVQTNIAKGEGEMISAGKTVKFHYVLTVKGEVVDSSQGQQPLEYVQGQGNIIKGLETQMEGLKVGDKKTVVVAPQDAYGVVDQTAIVEIPTANLGQDITPQPGMALTMTTSSGQMMPAKVVEVKPDTVVMDFNHPLAGQELTFQVEVMEVK